MGPNEVGEKPHNSKNAGDAIASNAECDKGTVPLSHSEGVIEGGGYLQRVVGASEEADGAPLLAA